MGTFPYSVAESISAFLLNPPIGIWNLHWQPKVTSIIIWPNNSTPNSGSKWLNSLIIKKSFNNLNLSLNFESKIIHLRFWLKRGKTMKIHSSLGFKKNIESILFESNHLVMVEVHVIIRWLKSGPFMESISILDIWVISIHLKH